MKVCGGCGETYHHHVDFCFHDGEVLAAARDDVCPVGTVLAEAIPTIPLSRELLNPAFERAQHGNRSPASPGIGGAILAVLLLGGGLVTWSMVTADRDEVDLPGAEP